MELEQTRACRGNAVRQRGPGIGFAARGVVARSIGAFSMASLSMAALAVLIPAAAMAQSPAPSGPPAVPVQVAVATRQDVPVLLRNIGVVQPYQSVLVRARVDGTLNEVLFTEGQDVKPGDILAQIDPRPYAAALAQAQAKKGADEAQLANAKADLTRYTNLAHSDFASRQQVDTQNAMVAQFQANIMGDEAAIATARLNLDFTNITSPIEGRVGLRMVDAGNQIHASDTTGIVTITQIHPIAVDFTLPQDDLPEIQAAMAGSKLPVEAYTSDDQTLLSTGQLQTTDNMIDQTTGTIKLKAVFANKDNKLWPGQFVNCRLQIRVDRGVVTIPSAAVQRGPDDVFVYAVRPDNTAAVVTKGLDANTQVVVNGQSRLQNGTRVNVIQVPKANS
jgi:multidrug efflux system membrane fusion protein